jgi:predicted transposase/invertase (TIGR01784 family)
MLPLDEHNEVVSIEYLPAELTPNIPGKKNSIVDVRCKDKNGRQFIVEMQMHWTDSFTSRVLFNASKAYIKQLGKGMNYNLLQPVYTLSFVAEIFDRTNPDEYYHHYQIVNVKDTGKQIKGLEFVFIELPKFKPGNRSEKKLHELWMRFLTEIKESTREVPEDLILDADTNEALSYLEEGAYSETEMYLYDKYWDAVSVEKSIISDGLAEGFAKGEAKGEVKGRAEGLVEGLAQGEAKGLAQGEAERKSLESALEKEKAALEREKAALEREKAEHEREKAALEAQIAELKRKTPQK